MGILIPLSDNNNGSQTEVDKSQIPVEEDDIQRWADLAGRRVGVLEHSGYQRLLTPEELPLTVQGQALIAPPPEGLQLVVVSNLAKAIRELAGVDGQGTPQLDAVFGPTPVLRTAVERDFPVKLADEGYNVGFQPLVIAAAPQEGLTANWLVAEINTVLERLREQGMLAEVYYQWYREDFSQIGAR